MTHSNLVTLFYTNNLRGDLESLPRLNTFLKHLKGDSRPLVVDIGGACDPQVWHCKVTGGRSMLIALDAMGFSAVNATEISEEERARLEALVSMALVDERYTHVDGEVLFEVTPESGDGHLRVILLPAESTEINGTLLTLEKLEKGQVGEVRVAVTEHGYHIKEAKIYTLPLDTPPDPSIISVVEFIIAEARTYQRRTGEE